MKYIFLLSGDFIDLAKEEIISLFEIKNCKDNNKLLIADLKNKKILIVGDHLAIAYCLSVGSAFKAAGHTIYFVSDISATGQFAKPRIQQIASMLHYCESMDDVKTVLLSMPLRDIEVIAVIGSVHVLKFIERLKTTILKTNWHPGAQWIASVYGPMQCMLKGVCAQCLQWQIDPKTGQRTKAVYACSWQHQPMELIDINNIAERLGQNRAQETLTQLWLDYLFDRGSICKV